MFENLREDWHTYDRQWSRQGMWVMAVYRFGCWRYSIHWRWLRLPFSFLYKLLKPISEILTGIELPCEVTLRRRFRIDHFGNRVDIGAGAKILGPIRIGDDVAIGPTPLSSPTFPQTQLP